MISVEPVSLQDRQAALEFYYHSCSPAERTAQLQELQMAEQRGAISLENLLIARYKGEIAGVLLFHCQPDESAFLWPPVVQHASLADEIADQLLQSASEQITQAGTRFIQVLLEPEEMDSEAMLVRNGFEVLSDLVYLQRPLSEPLPERSELQLQAVVYDKKSNSERFARVLEQTYEATLDCPTFTAIRDGMSALHSHQFSGIFTPEKWCLYQLDGEDVGLLLLNDHPDQSAWEVVYMGVVPAFRGRGIGRALLIECLHAVAGSGRDFVLLAVDCENRFALKIYYETGFLELAERRVFIRNCSLPANE